MLKDEELVAKVKEGDLESLECLVIRYQERLISFVVYLVKNEMEAEEIVQDTFFNLYKTIRRVDETRKFSTYLYQIAKNLSFSHLRKKKIELSLDEALVLGMGEDGLYDDYFVKETSEKLKQQVSSLEDKYRHPLQMQYHDGLSYGEIGEKLKLPVGTVKTRISRAKQILREKLKNEKH
jgi:RNA polymerase sigma-70 factor (ECF subfamily)